jgi:hypothetical protein
MLDFELCGSGDSTRDNLVACNASCRRLWPQEDCFVHWADVLVKEKCQKGVLSL